jgi:hypothetical protein
MMRTVNNHGGLFWTAESAAGGHEQGQLPSTLIRPGDHSVSSFIA